MNTRFIDWIWHVRGSLALAPGQSSNDAFDRLDSLLRQPGTSHERSKDTLTFRKKDQAAQDKMSVFERGILEIEHGAAGSVLRYRLTSRALLFCFLAPLLFLAAAQVTIVLGKFQKESAGTAEKAPKKTTKKDVYRAQNSIDKALGSPAPEKLKKDGKDKGKDKKPSPTPAYVFAAIFATLYIVGRILEDWLIRATFKKHLFGM